MGGDIKTKSAAGMLIAIVFAILIVINLISINWFTRLDLTDNNIYSLSEASRELVDKLNDRLVIKAYITEELPAPHNSDARYLKDLLDDYRAYSNGFLSYEFIDPVQDNKEEEAMGLRIPPVQFNVFKNDKTEFIKGYKGVLIQYGNDQEILPFIENIYTLEYDLSRAINKLIQSEIPTVAFTTGHREPEITSGLTWANQLLQKEYRVRSLDLKNSKNIPPDVDILFIVSPKEPFDTWELYLIDQFIMRGGRVAFLLDKFEVNIQEAMVLPVDNGLDSLLGYYGIGVRDNLVIDIQCNMIPVMRNMGQFQMQSLVNYPYYLSVTNFNKDNPIVKSLNSFNLLYVSPLDTDRGLFDGLQRSILFSSSEKTGLRSLPVDISPEKKYFNEDFPESNLPLGAVLSGHIESYFNDQYIPEFAGTDTISITETPEKIDRTDDARLVVIGSGSFVTDDHRQSSTGFIVMLNIADWLTQDKGLISIRSKQVGGRTLEVTSDGTKKSVKYINMFAMPIIVVIFGIARWQIRRSRKNKALV
jgi:gliding-associated putative ABC transporter substrate-binding component GldG